MRLPLLIDVHCHLRGPDEGAFGTETKSALASGFGTVLAMPNTDPPIISIESLQAAKQSAEGNIYCDVGFYYGTDGTNMSTFSDVADQTKGLKVYLDQTTGDLKLDYWNLEHLFTRWVKTSPILFHVEEPSTLLNVLQLATKARRWIHICHVSTQEQVGLIKQAKGYGAQVTAEVCPHHLVFTESDRPNLGAYGIMKPPLARMKDREALWGAIHDGVIDVIATDHAPHAPDEKDSDNPPFGVIAEPGLPLLWKLFDERRIDLMRLLDLTYANPYQIFGLQPDPQSYMLFDLEEEWVFDNSMVHSVAGRSPYHEMRVKGRIRNAYLHGQPVIKDGEILPEKKGVLI